MEFFQTCSLAKWWEPQAKRMNQSLRFTLIKPFRRRANTFAPLHPVLISLPLCDAHPNQTLGGEESVC